MSFTAKQLDAKRANIDEFNKAIEVVFGEIFLNEIQENDSYAHICRGELTNQGKWGDSAETKSLMMFIRRRMQKDKLAPKVKLDMSMPDKIIHAKNVIKYSGEKYSKSFYDRFHNIVKHDFEKYNSFDPEEISAELEKTFSKQKSPIKYDVDGWNYSEENDYDEEDWIYEVGKMKTHFYYNELDHYFSHLLYRIVNGVCSFRTNDTGLGLIKEQIAKNYKGIK